MSRVALVNTNEMKPAIAPIALDYIGGALKRAGHEVIMLDLNRVEDAMAAIKAFFAENEVRVVCATFRNSDDCFWPSGASFVPRLAEIVSTIKSSTHAPLVLGGSGFSIFPETILQLCGGECGIHGDGEEPLVHLVEAFETGRSLDDIPGLVRRVGAAESAHYISAAPHRPSPVSVSTRRDVVDNLYYFREGGQIGLETKRGCPGTCVYCADPLSKGAHVRERAPEEVADEVEALLAQGIDVLHLCDSEFNLPMKHALTVCEALIRRNLGERVKWYTYASVTPFPEELASAMRRAGCVGLNFGADSANAGMLSTYGRSYDKSDIAHAVRRCREQGMRVMLDLLLGGPGETRDTLTETIEFAKKIDPDCVGAALGIRVYPGTAFARQVLAEGPLSENPSLRWRPEAMGPLPVETEGERAFLRPVFFISEHLGKNAAQIVKEIIGGDNRFFAPADDKDLQNYNYNQNLPLVEAIRNGARGAYWDILRKMR